MWILGQDKALTNLNKIIYLYIEENAFGKYVIEAYYGADEDEYVWLGEYDNELRAQGVLDIIIGAMAAGKIYLELPER